MATVTTVLTLNDQMSDRLTRIRRSLSDVDSGIDKVKGNSVTFGVVAGNAITGLVNKTFELVQAIPQIGDAYTLTQARLGLITAEGENVADVNEKIYQSAQRAKSSYMDTAASVSKLGLIAGDAFANTDEIINFAELMNKSFKVGGASIEEQTAGMYQLTQAMAAGKLQGDEFRSIMENAPMLAQAISDFTGKSKGELKELSSEGLITADVIKGALFAASDDINSKFEEIPDTWGSTMQQIENQFYMAFGGIVSYISSGLAGVIYSVVQCIAKNAEVVIAILGGIAVIIGAILIPRILMMAASILFSAVAWLAMNAPIAIIALAVTGLLLLILKFPEVFGMVIGAAAAAGTAIINAFKFVGNAIIEIINMCIDAMNLIPGVDISHVAYFAYDSVSDAYSDAKEWATSGAEALAGKIKGFQSTFTQGYSGAGAGNISMPSVPKASGIGSLGDISDGVKGLNKKLSGSGSLKSVGETEIKSDNLKWLLDIASTKYQKEYQKAPVYVNVSTGDINSGTDEARLLRKLEDSIINAYNENLVVV